MDAPQSHFLSNGRLHLHHGPIDLIIRVWGADAKQAYRQAIERFQTILEELVGDLSLLRQEVASIASYSRMDGTAGRMVRAVQPMSAEFITPMAAVAGAVADEICAAMCDGLKIERAYVNNGGDIAFYLDKGQSLSAAINDGSDAGRATFHHDHPARGLATSGRDGRSHSLGIADAVSVVAKTAAAADGAATIIANHVNLPNCNAIKREKARTLAPDSDLGDRMVTVGVGKLTSSEISMALSSGQHRAGEMIGKNLIFGAALFLQGRHVIVGKIPGNENNLVWSDKSDRIQTA